MKQHNNKKGTISIEFLSVFIFLIFIFFILWIKISSLNEETELYKEKVEVEKISINLARKLDMASYSDGYSTNILIYLNTFISEDNYSIYVEKNYIVTSVGEREYLFKFNNMQLLKNDTGFIESPPFNLNEGEYKIKNNEGVVYIEKV